MPKQFNINATNRIIDANLNRAKEGLRVCEEITRFALNNSRLTSRLKEIRHQIDMLAKGLICRKELLKERNSFSDVGRIIYANELKRRDISDIFCANLQRVKESIRVLEEFSKILKSGPAVKFKNIRYKLYAIEKSAINLI